MKPLTEKERVVMEYLWAYGPMSVKEIRSHYSPPLPHVNTVATFVKILEQKGFVKHIEKSGTYIYSPRLTRAEVASDVLFSVIDSEFSGNIKTAISVLITRGKLSDDDMWDLMAQMRNSRN